MKKRIFSLITAMCLVLTLCPQLAIAAPTEVYTEWSSGNDTSSGNGTAESPYNLFKDALDAVADGGTIYIGENGAFVNDENDGMPLKITKNVTITTADSNIKPDLNSRKGGIVLGGNVTFRNIRLSLSNPNHALIAANGYTLTLDNVSYDTSAREIHLFGGALYAYGGDSISPEAGDKSVINITGKSSKFANIYAGSVNGSFDKPVDIIINDVSGTSIGTVYASGALEGIYDSDQLLNPDYEPTAPTASSQNYPVNGRVSVNLTNSMIPVLNLKTGGSSNASLTTSSVYRYECQVTDAEAITVSGGTFAPTALNNGADISIAQGAELDISALPALEVGDFTGGGTIVLASDSYMTVTGVTSGSTDFKVSGGNAGNSGIAEYEHMYIDTSSATGDGVFTFNYPSYSQPGIEISKADDGKWYTNAKPEMSVELESFDIVDTEIEITAEDVNGDGACITVEAVYTAESICEDIGMVPLVYSVEYKGAEESAESESLDEYGYEGCYEGNIQAFNMNFTPIEGTITVWNYSVINDVLGEIAVGTYNIDITAPTTSGEVTRSLVLVVTGEEEPADNTEAVVTYGDEFTMKADVAMNKTSVVGLDAEPDTVSFYSGDSLIGTADVIYTDENCTEGSATLTVNASKEYFVIGENKIRTVYGGSINLEGSENEDITVTVNKRELEYTVSDIEKEYDRSAVVNAVLMPANIVEGDSVTITADAVLSSANAGTYSSVTLSNVLLGGADLEYYSVSGGEKVCSAKINAKDIASNNITVADIADCVYTGEAIEPDVTVKDGEAVLTAEDYNVSYSNNINSGTATVTITGKGNYAGTRTVNFEILKAASVVTTTVIYGNTLKLEAEATSAQSVEFYSGEKLLGIAETDVETGIASLEVKTDKNNFAVGKNTVIAVCDGGAVLNGSASGEITVKLEPKDISLTIAEQIADCEYTGEAINPEIVILDGALVLGEEDYDVSYTDNTEVGTAIVTVTGKEYYTGTKVITFNIVDSGLEVISGLSEVMKVYRTDNEITVSPKNGNDLRDMVLYRAVYNEAKELTRIEIVSGNTDENGSIVFETEDGEGVRYMLWLEEGFKPVVDL